ncbi:putative quinol monooxygenase [Lacrimispora celerecrescens]|uniref:Quinol monooxygenase YgiN n=1 Tax=[Clostridium] celerecrescens 18A TaxID=1286362 RepID=A0A2M8Z1D5_9FIRM|nr:putative quinol monooxygenase [Lacrimispora celerecrescens]PJJ27254.1 quinol monooxygenase YgiN [[Clostridium] celerecrescens 18A]
MIKVVAENFIKSEKVEEFIVLAKQLVQDTRQNDAGCIRYELLQDIKDQQLLTILEEWEDQEALNKHMAPKHFKEAIALFADLVEKPGNINLYKTLV